MKVIMVTKLLPKTHYSRYLYSGLLNVDESVKIIFYTNKHEKIDDIESVKQVWSPHMYPFQVFKEVLKDRPDIVHIQHEFNMFGPFYTILLLSFLLLLLQVTRIRTVVTIHAVVPLNHVNEHFIRDLGTFKMKIPSIFMKMAFVLIYKPVAFLASAVIVHNFCFRRDLISSYRVNEKKIHVIPLGVDCRDLSIDQGVVSKWLKKTEGRRVILYCGYITPRKGLEYLLDAHAWTIKQNPNCLLVIAGGILPYHKNYANKIVEKINILGLSPYVILTGFVTDEEIHALYRIADLVVLPYTYSISSSLALSFSIQHKRPVIATNIGAFREEIENGKDGLLCPPRDSEKLRQALIKIMENPSLREEFSRNLQKKISERSWYNVGRKTYNLYKVLLQR